MEKFVLILSLFSGILIFSCTSHTEKETKPLFTIQASPVTLAASVDSISTNDSTKRIFIKATLNNKTLDSFKYASMACYWLKSFTKDSKDFDIDRYNVCFIDMEILEVIAPFKSKDYFFLLTAKKISEESRLRIGFNLIESTELNYKSQYDSLGNMKHVIWSNPVEVK